MRGGSLLDMLGSACEHGNVGTAHLLVAEPYFFSEVSSAPCRPDDDMAALLAGAGWHVSKVV